MKGWLLLVVAFLLWPGCSSQNECEEPNEIDFGEIVSTEKAKYLENDQVEYRCNPGYVLEGPEWIQCKGQEWTPHPPKCLAPCSITRQQLAAKNLFVFGNQRKARLVQSNQNLQFQCNEGYVLVVPSVRKCVDGYMDFPLCISVRGKNCSGPPMTENGDITTLSEKLYRSGSSVEFRCQTYYAMEGQNRSFCDNGTWTKVPICLDPCVISRTELESQKIDVKDEIDVPENIFIQRGHSIELTCKTGYVLEANSSQSAFVIQCDGTPSVIPKCKEITCNSPRISNGSFRPQRTLYHNGDLIRILCDSRFTFEPDNGEKVVECTRNGWSPSPKCVKTCLKPPGGDFIFNTTKSVFFPGDKLHYECKEGFQITNNTFDDTVTCTKTGWELTPSCVSIVCKTPFLENGTINPREDIFQHNMVVRFICNEGFTRVGSESAQCYHFGWSPQPPICKENVKPCPALPIISHGTVTSEPKAVFQHGDLLEVHCDTTFALYGSKIIECVDGEWAPLPSCIKEVRTCGTAPTIKNGFVVSAESSIYRHGDTVEYRCERRSIIIGTNPAKCLHGQWEIPSCVVNPQSCTRPKYADFQPTVQTTEPFKTDQFAKYRCGSNLHQTKCVNGLCFPVPRCEGTCPPPPQLPNAINVAEMRIYKTEEEISFKCQEHFLLRGPQKIKCEAGKWQTPPRCLDLRCKPPPEIDNGIIGIGNRTMFPPGEIVEYRCSTGFELIQLNPVRCENLKWSEQPVCKEKSCGSAPEIPNASLEQEDRELKYDSGKIINYTCNHGFDTEEATRKTCARGKWVGSFTCKDVRCSSPSEIPNGQITSEIKAKYLPQEKVYYRCNPGYTLLGSSFITCSKNRWIQTPRCADIGGKCRHPPPVENGDIVEIPKATYFPSDTVTYQCQNFYTLEGSRRVTCQNGHWSQPPTCRVACTVNDENMREHNIKLKWSYRNKIYVTHGEPVEFECRRGYKPHPNTRSLRTNCTDGKFDYPDCIPI